MTISSYESLQNLVEECLGERVDVKLSLSDYGADSVEVSNLVFKVNRLYNLNIHHRDYSFLDQSIDEVLTYLLTFLEKNA